MDHSNPFYEGWMMKRCACRDEAGHTAGPDDHLMLLTLLLHLGVVVGRMIAFGDCSLSSSVWLAAVGFQNTLVKGYHGPVLANNRTI